VRVDQRHFYRRRVPGLSVQHQISHSWLFLLIRTTSVPLLFSIAKE
jgi:hypothetical protein